MSVRQNLRDFIENSVPSWLSEGDPDNPGFGYRLLWILVLFVDAAIEIVSSGFAAARGRGTSVDVDFVGYGARGLIRNQDEDDEEYARRLGRWIDRAKENGSATRLLLAIHDYLRSHPRVRIFRRDGYCITVEPDRSIVIDEETAWDWDSESNPERNDPDNPYWSDLFIVVYTTSGTSEQWSFRPGTFAEMPGGDDGFAFGHMATWKERDELKSLILTCKSAHSCIRCLIWCSDNAKFNPADDASMPNGRWGEWGIASGSSFGPSDRDTTTCRFWEPR